MNYQQLVQEPVYKLINCMYTAMYCHIYENAYCRVATDILVDEEPTKEFFLEKPALIGIVAHHIQTNEQLMSVIELLYETLGRAATFPEGIPDVVRIEELVKMYKEEVYQEFRGNCDSLKATVAGLMTQEQQTEFQGRLKTVLGGEFERTMLAYEGTLLELPEDIFKSVEELVMQELMEQANKAVKH